MIHTSTTTTTTSTTTTTMNFKSRTAFKKTAVRKTYPRVDRRRTVRFHTQVAVYHKKYVANEATSSPSSSSSWLTMLEYGGIQTGVFDTLDQLRKNDRQASSSTVEYYCPRGLEDYCRTNHGSLQPHVLARRKHVVTAVLHEQAAQQQQQQRRGRFQFPQANDVDDATRIRQVSEASSHPHRHIAITRGAVDSQAALTIYAEQQQQQQPRPPQHNFPPHMQRDEMYQHPLTSSQNVVTPPVTPKKCFQFTMVDELMLS